MKRWVEIARALLVVALGAAPGVALSGVVETPHTVITALLVAAAATSSVAFLAGLPARWLAAAIVGGEIAVVLAVSAFAPQRGDRRGLVDAAIDAVAQGWSTLLTSPVPADPSPRTLVPLAMVVWAATASAAAVTGRASRDRAHVTPATALVPLAGAIVASAIAAGREQYHPVSTGCAVAAASGAYLATFRPPRRDGARAAGGAGRVRRTTASRRSALGAAAVAVGVATATGFLLGPSLTFGRDAQPFDPRDRIDPPTVPAGAVSPLELFASRQLSPAEPMFVVESAEPVLTRLVALDRFDGARWTSGAAYRPSGTVIDAPVRDGVASSAVSAHITVDGLSGPWLPVTGDPVRVTGVSFRIDPSSGSLLASAGDALGAEYTVDALVPQSDVTLLQSLAVATDDEALDALSLPPGVPSILQEMAQVATGGGSTPLLSAALLQDYLQRSFERDEQYTAGHSYGHLVRAFTQVGAGTEEQFASAFAVLGRIVGLPTRVVVGFGPGELQADGTYRVRAGDGRVWPEVKFEGAGWVPFDPSPARDDRDGVDVPIGPGGGGGFIIQEAEATTALDATTPPPAPARTASGTAWWFVIASVVLALLAIAVLVAATVVLAKRRRTLRRRFDGDATERVVGAWSDVLDRFVEIDGRDPRRRTVDELVDASAGTTTALAGLYRPVLRALYDDDECTDHDAEQAWRARDRFVRACRQEASRRRRAAWTVDPRPLARRTAAVHYRRTTPRQEAEMSRSST